MTDTASMMRFLAWSAVAAIAAILLTAGFAGWLDDGATLFFRMVEAGFSLCL